MRMLLALVLVVVPSVAAAGETGFSSIGFGTAIQGEQAGIVVRYAAGNDIDNPSYNEDAEEPIAGAGAGIEVWKAGGGWGFEFPFGWYVGGQVGHIRTALGTGVGMFSLASRRSDYGFGITPFGNAMIEIALSKRAHVTLDARIGRHVLGGADDFTRYSMVVMLGNRMK